MVRKLLRAGADINASGFYNGTPFHLASRNGYDVVVQQLLKAGADMNAKCRHLDLGRLKNRSKERSYDDWTPLHLAPWSGYDAVVQRLLEVGAIVQTLLEAGASTATE